jgi:hypothetical protein
MRLITLAFLLTLSGNSNSQTKNPFLKLKFDKVFICDFENDGEHDYPLVNEKGQWTNIVKKSAKLDPLTTSKLITKLGDKQSYGQTHADCFEPHFGIVFFKEGKDVAEVEICLDCNVLSPTLIIPAQNQGKAGHGKEVYYTHGGMSKQFRRFINGLIKQYNFSHPMEAGLHWDK